jgi:hypothetical protein
VITHTRGPESRVPCIICCYERVSRAGGIAGNVAGEVAFSGRRLFLRASEGVTLIIWVPSMA